MEDWKNRLLKAFPHLTELTEQDMALTLDNVAVTTNEPGTVMIEQGRRCRGAALILSGVIRVYKLSPDGKQITLYRVGEGETCVLAISCLMGGVDYPVIAEVEDEAEVVMLPLDVLRTLMQRSEPWQRFIFAAMSQSMMDMMNLVDEIAFRRMDERLAARLLQCEIGRIELTHEQLAADIGTAREVVSRLLKELENNGLIELKRGLVIIRDRKGLEKAAGL